MFFAKSTYFQSPIQNSQYLKSFCILVHQHDRSTFCLVQVGPISFSIPNWSSPRSCCAEMHYNPNQRAACTEILRLFDTITLAAFPACVYAPETFPVGTCVLKLLYSSRHTMYLDKLPECTLCAPYFLEANADNTHWQSKSDRIERPVCMSGKAPYQHIVQIPRNLRCSSRKTPHMLGNSWAYIVKNELQPMHCSSSQNFCQAVPTFKSCLLTIAPGKIE